MNISRDIYKAVQSTLVSSVLIAAMVMATYVAFEPLVSRGQTASDTFTIQQSITGEISFLVTAADVTMVGGISGLTGGYATGTTYAVVTTNDPDGYNMTIKFPYATTTGMDGDATASYVNSYTPAAAGVPDYGFVSNASGGAAEFGYTVNASTTADLDTTFRNNGTVCNNAGGGDQTYKCWLNGSTTDETIVNRTSGSAPTGATTTIRFKVSVPSSPNPSLDVDTYTATATLTATVN